MSRVKENVKAINDMNENLKNVGPEGFLGLMIHKPELVSSIMASSQCDIIVDISKSLAVIADDIHYFREKDEAKGWSLGIHGTEQICGFCDKAEYTTMDIDEAIYHCLENDTNVAFTCPGCDKFIDVRKSKKLCEEKKHPFLWDVESRLKASGITSEEWETWVELRDKYLYAYGDKEIKE